MYLTLLLLSSAARAETYHLAACEFTKTTSGWTAQAAFDGTREAVNGVMVKVAQAASEGGGYCELLRGTGDDTSADVLLNSANGSGISVSPSCEFRGQVNESKTAHQTLVFGESITVEYGSQQREGVYFASPDETTQANWVSAACQKVAASLVK